MNILNLYCGIGGNRKLWTGHEVTAVDNNADVLRIYQDQNSGDTVIKADAKEYLLDRHASNRVIQIGLY